MRRPDQQKTRLARRPAAVALAIAAAWGTVPAAGQTTTLTLDEAVALALEGHPSVGASEATERAVRATADRAAAARWPSLHLDASAARYEQPMLVAPLHEFDPQSVPPLQETLLQGSVIASYTLFDGGERRATTAAARSRADAATAALDEARADLVLGVTRQYAAVLAAGEALRAHDGRLDALEEELDRARRLLEVGRAPEVQVLRAQAAAAGARADQVRSRTALETAERELARLVGVPEDRVRARGLAPIRLAGTGVPERDAMLHEALVSAPEIWRHASELEAAGAEVARSRSAFLPDVRVFGRYDNRGATEGDFFREWSFGGSISFPLFQGGARRHETARTRAERTAAERRLDLAGLEIRSRVDLALASLQEADARTRALESAVDQYEEVVRAERLAIETGTGSQTDYIAAEADLLSARAQLAQASMERITARAELARVTGRLDTTWLRENLESER